MDVARDPLLKKSVPPFLNRKQPAEPRLDCVDYGTSSLALDSASQCPTRNKEDGKDEVPSKLVVKVVNNEGKVDAPNSLAQKDDLNLEESALDDVVKSPSASPIELQEPLVSNDKNEVKSTTTETCHREHKKDVKNKIIEKKTESKKSRDKKSESKTSHNDKKSVSKKSHDDKTSEFKTSRYDKKSDKKSHEEKSELESHKKADSKQGHDNVMKQTKTKSLLTLKPVSQLKESSLFGSLLENVEKSSQKKRKLSSQGG